MDLNNALKLYHKAADEFSRGDPEPVKKIFSHKDDVTLANPFGPPVAGWEKVSDALDFASSRMRDGWVKEFEVVKEYKSADLATILAIEYWNSKVNGRNDVSPFTLRVTSTFRKENGDWKLVHRHADPIASANPDGPLRKLD